jgi:transcriptional regulator with GAF, ATPase, and Fis domain
MPNRRPQTILDLTRDLAVAVDLGASPEQVNALLGQAIDALGRLVSFDLATVMELREDTLHVRIARGPLDGPKVRAHSLPLERFSGIRDLLRTGRARAFGETDHRDGDGDAFDNVLDLPHGHSCMVVPLRVRDEALGIMTFDRETCGRYPDEVVALAEVFGRLLAVAMSYGQQSAMLGRLHAQAQEQSRILKEHVVAPTSAAAQIEASRSAAMVRIAKQARRVAATDTPVLILGETGTGKEVLANAIHGWSARSERSMISLNCAALPANLIESELFGHVKGAFSGATAARIGRFQAANGGSLFLDEIGDMPLDLQPKLLRAVQEGCFEPVGSDRTVRVDVRIIAATHHDLAKAVSEGRFREDLYYRLAVFPLHLPPLRERGEDMIPIAEGFLADLAQRSGRGPWTLTEASRRWIETQSWPGNVRELINALERATILAAGPTLDVGAPRDEEPTDPAAQRPQTDEPDAPLPTLEQMERRHIERALARTAGKIHGPGGCAEILGINPNTLRSRMKKLGIAKTPG